jgi:uncharacterized protein YggT (Ycf19 family)
MTYEEHRTTVEQDVSDPSPPPADGYPARTGVRGREVVEQHEQSVYRPSGATLAARVVAAVFGIIQALLLIRIVLLLLDAQRGNGLVRAILDTSQVVVAPFEGMFRTNALASGGAVLDIAAITALVALTILEFVILAIVRIPRHSEDI